MLVVAGFNEKRAVCVSCSCMRVAFPTSRDKRHGAIAIQDTGVNGIRSAQMLESLDGLTVETGKRMLLKV